MVRGRLLWIMILTVASLLMVGLVTFEKILP
jgi:hypothetical protein